MKKMVMGLVVWSMVFGFGVAWGYQIMLMDASGGMKVYEVYEDADLQMILNYDGKDLAYGYRYGNHWVLMDNGQAQNYQGQVPAAGAERSEQVTVLDDQGRLQTYRVRADGDRVEIFNYETGELTHGRWTGDQGYFLNMNTGKSQWIRRSGEGKGYLPLGR
ncbi:MAG: hypothetical protein H8E10_08150 [Desulfobacterales bacterium]|nr:hypothetical protein [Desulfobacterales bacterium]